MSAHKHTPGPCAAKDAMSHGTTVVGPNGVSIAWCSTAATYVRDGSYCIRTAEAAANARLIAAAPTMLTALRGLVDNSTRADWPEDLIDAAESAIKDATEPKR